MLDSGTMLRRKLPRLKPGHMCPTCRSILIEHCAKSQCAWVRCEKCGGYGYAVGSWVSGKPS